ncbi:MAG: carbohydrate transporter permease [Clostridiales bacterium]|jgi:multiple sugar transport system permease protein|nr:carbohydrate transporter permease [Clostridiales bacterium]
MKKKEINIGKSLLYIVLIFVALATLYPFLWMISASFKPLKEIVNGNMSLYSDNMSFDNYIYIFGRSSLFPKWFINSFMIATVGTVINIFVNTMAGYSLSRLDFPGKNKIFFLLMALIMIPGQVLMIPNYLIIQQLGMLDKYSALIIPAAANIGSIIMMRQFFVNFPRDVEEAASIDGLGRYGRFFRICMPLAKPIISTQAVFIFMGFWNEFTKPMLYMKTETKYTLTLGLQTFSSKDAGTMWHQVMAAATITVIPIVIIYLIFNKYFLVGVRMDGEK